MSTPPVLQATVLVRSGTPGEQGPTDLAASPPADGTAQVHSGVQQGGIRGGGTHNGVRMGKPPDPRDLGAKCEHCPFAKAGAPNRPVLGEGPSDSVGILVGETPGREDVEVGRVFQGATGKQLDIELAQAGLRRSRLFMVNAVCCPRPINAPDTMTRKAVSCCRPALLAQLAQFPDTTPTMAMGGAAYAALTYGVEKKDLPAMTDVRGFLNPKWTIPR